MRLSVKFQCKGVLSHPSPEHAFSVSKYEGLERSGEAAIRPSQKCYFLHPRPHAALGWDEISHA
jgi:hypothetical protein